MPRRSPGECCCHPGRAPFYQCTVAILGLCRHSSGLHLGTTGHNWGVAVALPGSVWAQVEIQCLLVVPAAVPVVSSAGPSFPVTPGSFPRY
ncbi:hypothetical protein DPMN_127968 [Dreissena polymorpha]|uniref:Uncharacterized protein n=1 Tax=Dreissena polymorpha TaxID=45954 RepID=A0A9D4H083_DREPO|nr:hypothetical protein DPMN_127968 [Dreissena polymorpha]